VAFSRCKLPATFCDLKHVKSHFGWNGGVQPIRKHNFLLLVLFDISCIVSKYCCALVLTRTNADCQTTMNAPPSTRNILIQRREISTGCLVDYGKCPTSPKDAKQSPGVKRQHLKKTPKLVRRERIDELLKDCNKLGISKQPLSDGGLRESKEDEKVCFDLRRKLVKRKRSNDEDVLKDRNHFELPRSNYRAIPDRVGSSRSMVSNLSRHRMRQSLALGRKTRSCASSIGGRGTRTNSPVSLGGWKSTAGRPNAPGRSVSEPIHFLRTNPAQQLKEITVDFSPRKGSPRKIDDGVSLEETTGLAGINCLRGDCNARKGDSATPTIDFSISSTESPGRIQNNCRRIRLRKKSKKNLAQPNCSRDSDQSSLSISQTSPVRDVSVVSTRQAGADDSEVQRKCYVWYGRLGQPTREAMKRRVAVMACTCDITPEDVDKLAWICGGSRVSVAAMNASLRSKAPCHTKSPITPGRTSKKQLRAAMCKKEIPSDEQDAGESSCERPVSVVVGTKGCADEHIMGLAIARSQSPSCTVRESVHRVRPSMRKNRVKEQMIREALQEGQSLQQMLTELSPRHCTKAASSTKTRNLSSSSGLRLPIGEDPTLELSSSKRSFSTNVGYSSHTPDSSRKPKMREAGTYRASQSNSSGKRQTKKLCRARSLDELPMKQGPFLKPTSVSKHPGCAELDLDSRTLKQSTNKNKSTTIKCKGDRLSLWQTRIFTDRSKQRLDPAVASFMGLDDNELSFTVGKRKGLRPDFVHTSEQKPTTARLNKKLYRARSLDELPLKRHPLLKTTSGTKYPGYAEFDLDSRTLKPTADTVPMNKRNTSKTKPEITGPRKLSKAGRPSLWRANRITNRSKQQQQLDPVVASFLGLDSNELPPTEEKRKNLRPEFVQALCFFNAKNNVADDTTTNPLLGRQDIRCCLRRPKSAQERIII